MGHRPALVSADARQSSDSRGRVRLAQRLVDLAQLFRRQPARQRSTSAAARRPASSFTITPAFRASIDGAFFMCDWSQGRIWPCTWSTHDGTYQGTERNLSRRPAAQLLRYRRRSRRLALFLRRRAQHGRLDFSHRGRRMPSRLAASEQGICGPSGSRSFRSAWAAARSRDVKKETGDSWGPALVAVAVNAKAAAGDRVRALDLMQLFSPAPSSDAAGAIVA